MHNCRRVVRSLLYLLLVCFLTFTSLLAQTNLGTVQGHIQDPQNNAIGGASVTLRNPSTAFQRTVQTDSSGNYSFMGVPLTGSYVLTVNAPQVQAG